MMKQIHPEYFTPLMVMALKDAESGDIVDCLQYGVRVFKLKDNVVCCCKRCHVYECKTRTDDRNHFVCRDIIGYNGWYEMIEIKERKAVESGAIYTQDDVTRMTEPLYEGDYNRK